MPVVAACPPRRRRAGGVPPRQRGRWGRVPSARSPRLAGLAASRRGSRACHSTASSTRRADGSQPIGSSPRELASAQATARMVAVLPVVTPRPVRRHRALTPGASCSRPRRDSAVSRRAGARPRRHVVDRPHRLPRVQAVSPDGALARPLAAASVALLVARRAGAQPVRRLRATNVGPGSPTPALSGRSAALSPCCCSPCRWRPPAALVGGAAGDARRRAGSSPRSYADDGPGSRQLFPTSST